MLLKAGNVTEYRDTACGLGYSMPSVLSLTIIINQVSSTFRKILPHSSEVVNAVKTSVCYIKMQKSKEVHSIACEQCKVK